MRLLSRGLGVLCALIVSLAIALPAQASFVGVGSDPSGDATDGSAARDIIAVGMGYDRESGELRGAVQLGGSSEGVSSFITLVAATSTASGCSGFPAGAFGTYSDEFGASWLRLDSPAGGPTGDALKRGFDSALQRFEAEESALAGHRFDCVIAQISEPGNPGNVFDSVGPIALRGLPALAMQVRGVPRQLDRNRTRRLKITVENEGDGPARGVKLSLGSARGLSRSPGSKALGSLAPGERRTVKAKVTLSARARSVTPLTVKVSAGKLVARQKIELRLRKPKKGEDGEGGYNVCTGFSPDLSGLTGGSLILYPC